jgi:hypothetical protein
MDFTGKKIYPMLGQGAGRFLSGGKLPSSNQSFTPTAKAPAPAVLTYGSVYWKIIADAQAKAAKAAAEQAAALSNPANAQMIYDINSVWGSTGGAAAGDAGPGGDSGGDGGDGGGT